MYLDVICMVHGISSNAVNGFVSTSVYMYVYITPSVHAYTFLVLRECKKVRKSNMLLF
jgi:hypothetical protein